MSELNLIMDVEMQWNSTLEMLQSILELSERVNTALIQLGKRTTCFSDDELEEVKQAVIALKPFMRVTEEMSS